MSLGRSLSSAARRALDAADEKPQTTTTAAAAVMMMPRWARSPAALFRRIGHALSPFLFLLLPSFVASYLRPGSGGTTTAGGKKKKKPPRRLHPTSYLDGLRGVAAFIVYVYHFSLMWRYQDLEIGYWSPWSGHYWYQLPFVRLLVSGRASVTVFFVISGYVLSTRPLQLIHQYHHHHHQQHRGATTKQQQKQQASNKVLDALSSAVLRRPFRLYLPIAAATFLLSVLVQARFPFRTDPLFAGGGVAYTADGLRAQLANWWATMARLVDPFHVEGTRGGGQRHPVTWYIAPLWTIPTEFKGSLAVFLALLAGARVRRRGAVVAATALGGVVWQLRVGDADMALFMAGLVLAEMCILAPPSPAYSLSAAVAPTPGRRLLLLCAHLVRHVFFSGLFLLALWLLSTPMIDTAGTPGYQVLAGLAPAPYYVESPELEIANMVHLYWLAVGSMLLVYALMYAPPARMVIAMAPDSNSSSGSDSIGTRCVLSPAADEEAPPPLPQEHNLLGIFDSSASLSSSTVRSTTTMDQGTIPLVVGQEHEQKDHHRHQQHQQPLLQQLFTNRVAQYLGALSYSLYLLHEPVNHVIGSRYAALGHDLWQTYEEFAWEDETTAAQLARVLPAFRRRYWSWYVVGFVGNTVVLVWVSDLFMRAVDRPSVRFARWVGRVVEGRRG